MCTACIFLSSFGYGCVSALQSISDCDQNPVTKKWLGSAVAIAYCKVLLSKILMVIWATALMDWKELGCILMVALNTFSIYELLKHVSLNNHLGICQHA